MMNYRKYRAAAPQGAYSLEKQAGVGSTDTGIDKFPLPVYSLGRCFN
jgi:hypothetical protein